LEEIACAGQTVPEVDSQRVLAWCEPKARKSAHQAMQPCGLTDRTVRVVEPRLTAIPSESIHEGEMKACPRDGSWRRNLDGHFQWLPVRLNTAALRRLNLHAGHRGFGRPRRSCVSVLFGVALA